MLRNNNRQGKTTLILGLVGLLLLLAVAASPALANSIFLDRLRTDPQSVIVEDATGRHGGILHADLTGSPDGSVSGPMTLQVGQKTYDFAFNQVEEIRLDENGRPNGIALRGTGTMTEDDVKLQLLNLQASVQLESDDATEDPIFQISGDCVLDQTIIGAAVDLAFGGE